MEFLLLLRMLTSSSSCCHQHPLPPYNPSHLFSAKALIRMLPIRGVSSTWAFWATHALLYGHRLLRELGVKKIPAPHSLLEALCHRSTPLPAFVASPRDFHQPLRLLASFYPPEHPPPNSLLEPLCHRSTPLSRLCSLASPRLEILPSPLPFCRVCPHFEQPTRNILSSSHACTRVTCLELGELVSPLLGQRHTLLYPPGDFS